jgi:hypothetical protein
MKAALLAKHSQHEYVRHTLSRTGRMILVEESPVDNFWGAGEDYDGKNMVGVLWMEIRDETTPA